MLEDEFWTVERRDDGAKDAAMLEDEFWAVE